MKRIEAYHQQVILIVGFIGGLVFAGLVLVVGNPAFILGSSEPAILASPKAYLNFVAAWLAFTSGLSGITVVMSLRALSMKFRSWKGHRRMYSMVDLLTGAVFVFFEASLAFILAPVNEVVSLVLFVLLAIIFAATTAWMVKARKSE
jgi:uncharacterized membrane protein YdcZ (DUF606 family)